MKTILLLLVLGQTQQQAMQAVDSANMTNAEATSTQIDLEDQDANVESIELATKAEYAAGDPNSDPPGGPWPANVGQQIQAADAIYYSAILDRFRELLGERMEASDEWLADAQAGYDAAIDTINAGGTVTPAEWQAIIDDADKSDGMCAQVINICKPQMETRFNDALALYFSAALMMSF